MVPNLENLENLNDKCLRYDVFKLEDRTNIARRLSCKQKVHEVKKYIIN